MLKILFFLLIPITFNAQSVFKTPSGKKYHLGTCRMLNNVSQEISLSTAVELGLEPCKICNPGFGNISTNEPIKHPSGEKNTVQCKAMTKSGMRCRHMTSIANGYCFQHNPEKNNLQSNPNRN